MKRSQRSAVPIHPAQRFIAPSAIQHGKSLAQLIGPDLVKLLAESLAAVYEPFQAKRFQRRAVDGLGELGLMDRAAHVGQAMAAELPDDFERSAQVLIASLGPELAATEGNGLAPFFYLPHSQVVFHRGSASLPAALQVCYELTKRFTAEFCIRPLLIYDPENTLQVLRRWTTDPNPHVRRLVSEGTRPRLPWGLRLRMFQDDPRPTLALLEQLVDDVEPYVRRSVANHLGDVLKDNPDLGYATCERWLAAAQATNCDPAVASSRNWIVRHALRLPAKKGVAKAVALRHAARG